LPSSWDEFLAQLSRNFRSQIKRQYKRILESDDLSFRTVNADDAEQFAEKLADLNRHRMRDKEKTSSAEDPRFRRFLVEVIPYMAGKGIAQMDILEQQGKAVGAALNFTHGETIYYYMGGFDKSITKLGPGNAIFSHVIQRGIENGFTKYDFLRGDEPYKYRWGAIDTPIQSLTIYPANRIRGNIAYAMDVISEGPVKIS
jgi:CelD/BcsL family acetyltransferase involved in cellulose biosynthesis